MLYTVKLEYSADFTQFSVQCKACTVQFTMNTLECSRALPGAQAELSNQLLRLSFSFCLIISHFDYTMVALHMDIVYISSNLYAIWMLYTVKYSVQR